MSTNNKPKITGTESIKTSTSKKFEDIYSKPNNAPWTYSTAPKELEELINSGVIPKNSRILEVGCGEGYQSIYLAQQGNTVVGIDSSKNAIKYAKDNVKKIKKTLDLEFKLKTCKDLEKLNEKFDFIFDWRMLHEITDEQDRVDYFKCINNLLTDKGKYISVAFSGDTEFMGSGTIRKSPVGIEIYFETLKSGLETLGNYFNVLENRHISVPQKPNLIISANYFLMEK